MRLEDERIRIVHTGDNHLDPYFPRLGAKQMERRMDFWRSFKEVVEFALRTKPHLFLVSGDLFDRVDPRNPPRAQVIKCFRAMDEKGIRSFLIGGNHDTPRSMEEGSSPLNEIDATGYSTLLWEGEAETFNVGGTEICVSGISYDFTLSESDDPLSRVKISTEGDFNVFMAHYPLRGIEHPMLRNEPRIGFDKIPDDLNYLALGHVHSSFFRRMGDSRYLACPGSTERRSFNEESDEKKGFFYLEFSGDGKLIEKRFVEVSTRPMKTLRIKAKGNIDLNSEVIGRARELSNEELLLRVIVSGRVSLDTLGRYRRDEIIRELSEMFFAVQVNDEGLEYEGGEVNFSPGPDFSPLSSFREYVEEEISSCENDEEREVLRKVLEIGIKYLEEEGAW